MVTFRGVAGTFVAVTALTVSTLAWVGPPAAAETQEPQPIAIVRTANGGVDTVPVSEAANRDVVAVSRPVPAVMMDIAANEPMRSSQWPLDMVQAPQAWDRSTGTGIIVAVVDSGVNGTLPDLVGKTVAGQDFTGDTPVNIPPGADSDPYGHGTFVSTVIAAGIDGRNTAGVAPGVSIMPIRVFDEIGSGTSTAIAAGITWAVVHGAKVINLSLCTLGDDRAISTAINAARIAGAVVVAATGNFRSSGNPAYPPATYPGVLGVGAVGSDKSVANFSTAGSQVDVVAPGHYVPAVKRDGSVVWISGTSFSTPHVAAEAALLMALPGATRTRTELAIKSGVLDLGPAGKDDDYGLGLAQFGDAMRAFDAQPPNPQDPEPPYVEPPMPPEDPGPPPGVDDSRSVTVVKASIAASKVVKGKRIARLVTTLYTGKRRVPNALVTVWFQGATSWRKYAQMRVSSAGVLITYLPYAAGRRVKVTFAGTTKLKPSTSPMVRMQR